MSHRIDFDFDKNCVGCGNCVQACPTGAVRLTPNLYPEIDKGLCTNCGRCTKVCPHLCPNAGEGPHLEKAEVFAAFARDEQLQYRASSGGIASVLTHHILQNKGYVCGCIWDKNLMARHILTNNVDEAAQMRRSKYTQSDLCSCISQISELLRAENDVPVLFIGTSCQVASLYAYTGRQKMLYTCAIACEGAPIRALWGGYKKCLEQKAGAKLVDADFRSKIPFGWESPSVRFTYDKAGSKKHEYRNFGEEPYIRCFYSGIALRGACSRCAFRGEAHRADLLIGDHWGYSTQQLGWSKNKGISFLFSLTPKGKALTSQLGHRLVTQPVSFDEVVRKNQPVITSAPEHPQRAAFTQALLANNTDTMQLMRNYIPYRPAKHYLSQALFYTRTLGFFKRAKYFLMHMRRRK